MAARDTGKLPEVPPEVMFPFEPVLFVSLRDLLRRHQGLLFGLQVGCHRSPALLPRKDRSQSELLRNFLNLESEPR
jgi:hypothetical protein